MASRKKLDLSVFKKLREQLDPAKFDRVMDMAFKEIRARVTPKARQFLLENYDNSGLGEKSGDLRRAVQKAEVLFTKSGMVCVLPRGMSNKFYTYASSQNYGANRKSGAVTKSTKRKLKNFAAKEYAKTGARKQAGGNVYIPPKEFMYFTTAQEQTILYLISLVIQEVFDKEYK